MGSVWTRGSAPSVSAASSASWSSSAAVGCCSDSCRRVRAEKYPENMELACKMVKETLDKKYGAPWHVRICGSALRSLSAPDA